MNYEALAYYYDGFIDPKFYDDYYNFICQHAQFQNVLELGCGTGEMAIRFAKDGYDITASDISDEMLEVAMSKAMENEVNISFKKVDMTDFSSHQYVDLVLCLCDSINYVQDEKLIIKAFKNAYDILTVDGAFIFDVNSLYKMDTILNNYYEFFQEDDFSLEWNVEHIHTGEICHHVIIREGEDTFLEDHYQKTYSIETYLNWLHHAGFRDIQYYSDFDNYHDDCERIIFICKKE